MGLTSCFSIHPDCYKDIPHIQKSSDQCFLLIYNAIAS